MKRLGRILSSFIFGCGILGVLILIGLGLKYVESICPAAIGIASAVFLLILLTLVVESFRDPL